MCSYGLRALPVEVAVAWGARSHVPVCTGEAERGSRSGRHLAHGAALSASTDLFYSANWVEGQAESPPKSLSTNCRSMPGPHAPRRRPPIAHPCPPPQHHPYPPYPHPPGTMISPQKSELSAQCPMCAVQEAGMWGCGREKGRPTGSTDLALLGSSPRPRGRRATAAAHGTAK